MTAPFICGMERARRPRVYLCQEYRYHPLHITGGIDRENVVYDWGNLKPSSRLLATDILRVVLDGEPDDALVEAFAIGVVAVLPSPFCLTFAIILDWASRWTAKRPAPLHR